MTTRLVGAALAALALLPATAQAAALAPLKPCYISVTQTSPGAAPQITRESLDLAGNGFTAGSLVDVSFNGKLDRTIQADAAGNLPPQILQSPYQAKGQGTFTLTAAERGNPANTVALPSRTTALTLKLKPEKARPSKRIRFRGAASRRRRRCGRTTSTRARSARPCGWCRRIKNPCGTFSVKRKQIPIKRPKLGRAGGCRSTSRSATAARPTA